MSFIKKEIKAAVQAFKYWILPPAMRRYEVPVPGSRLYRYPSLGSEPLEPNLDYIDYKTAYRDSTHHIRHYVDTKKTLDGKLYYGDALGETVEEKLHNEGFLRKEDFGNKDAIEKAKEEFEKFTGLSADIRVQRDDLGFSNYGLTPNNREGIAEFVAGLFEGVKEYNATEAWYNDLEDTYHPSFYILRNFDMAADDPVYRQLVVDMTMGLDEMANKRLAEGKQAVFKSDPAYWAILDDSYSGENRKKLQSSVRNFVGHTDLTPAVWGEGEIPVQKESPTVHVPHVSPYL